MTRLFFVAAVVLLCCPAAAVASPVASFHRLATDLGTPPLQRVFQKGSGSLPVDRLTQGIANLGQARSQAALPPVYAAVCMTKTVLLCRRTGLPVAAAHQQAAPGRTNHCAGACLAATLQTVLSLKDRVEELGPLPSRCSEVAW